MSANFACCFCGDTIAPQSPDVGSILYTTNRDKTPDLQHSQELFCHTKCLQRRLHPSAALGVLSLLSNEPLTQEELEQLPEFMR